MDPEGFIRLGSPSVQFTLPTIGIINSHYWRGSLHSPSTGLRTSQEIFVLNNIFIHEPTFGKKMTRNWFYLYMTSEKTTTLQTKAEMLPCSNLLKTIWMFHSTNGIIINFLRKVSNITLCKNKTAVSGNSPAEYQMASLRP